MKEHELFAILSPHLPSRLDVSERLQETIQLFLLWFTVTPSDNEKKRGMDMVKISYTRHSIYLLSFIVIFYRCKNNAIKMWTFVITTLLRRIFH